MTTATATTDAGRSIFITTLDQLTHAPEGSGQGVGRIRAMVGASAFALTELDGGDVLGEFSFKMCRKFNRCQITYNAASDTYSLRLAKVSRLGVYAAADFMADNLYAYDLARVFTENTGLDTHL
jgi:hypothetical protein